MHNLPIPDVVMQAYSNLGSPRKIEPITMGLINKTYLVETDRKNFVLQEVSPIFDTTINEDSAAVCRHLALCNIISPTILPTDSNELFVVVNKRIFRALRHINGQSFHTIKSLAMAKSAGAILGKFHVALIDFDYEYRSKRHHGGSYNYHKDVLVNALAQNEDHDYFDRVKPFAEQMLNSMSMLTDGFSTTPRNAHGDPKISNIIFDANDEAICLVDFDTLGKTGWSLEIADALRSWCNPNKEDVIDAQVDLSIAEHALLGYGSTMKGKLSQKEGREIVTHSQAISLCLAMRYLADVLNEKYWAYDRARFSRPAEHNWLRATAMHNLYKDFSIKQSAIFAMVKDFLY